VTHLQSVEGSIFKIKLSEEENLKMLERTDNIRGLYVKLADRMHNMRTISGHRTLSKQQRVAEETVQLYVPLAERLGLHEAAQELKSRCTQVLSRGPR
ncbi:MAG: HD domain-containing protein, partial [Bacteroidota bacterium]